MIDVKNDLINDLGLEEGFMTPALEKLLESNSKYLKDLRINLKNVLTSEYLSEKETALIALAVAVNNQNKPLESSFSNLAKEKGATVDEIGETVACASLLSSNNIFYRFRHFVGKEKYNTLPARIKMSIMVNPILGKEFFELTSLAVSAVNGCEACVAAHEQSVLQHGSSEERVLDAIRLAAIVTSLGKVIN
ncbi:MAG TPA: carboxymuconolactone decarboxylase family protein [Cytophagaceae bacterium]